MALEQPPVSLSHHLVPSSKRLERCLCAASYGLDIDQVAVLRPLPQGLDSLQLAAVKSEARPGGQLEQGAGDRHKHQHVEAAETQRRSP